MKIENQVRFSVGHRLLPPIGRTKSQVVNVVLEVGTANDRNCSLTIDDIFESYATW